MVLVPLCHTSFKVSDIMKLSSIYESFDQCTPLVPLALLIYVSGIFIAKGIYDFPTVMQVYSLVLFSVTFASQFMDFSMSLKLTAAIRRRRKLRLISQHTSSPRDR